MRASGEQTKHSPARLCFTLRNNKGGQSAFSFLPPLSRPLSNSHTILIIIMATTLPPFSISAAEASWLSGGIVSGIRGDGRGAADVRPIAVTTGVLPSASGSGEARMAGTHAMVGVKVNICE